MKALIFDLDGTLADTLADIGAAMNHALESMGLPTHPLAAYAQFVGEGVERLAERALPPQAAARKDEAVAAYAAHYAKSMFDRSHPYSGIPELLDEFNRRGLPLAVLSNKPHDATRQMIATLFGRWPWRAVVGQRSGIPKKPDPTAALAIAHELECEPARIGFIGDTAVDMQTARAAGMRAIGVLWGFRDRLELEAAGAQLIVTHPAEILKAVWPPR